MSATPSHDWILVGGGLANGLLALALAEAQPRARIALVERDERLGGNHTWSFHDGDAGDDARRALVAPLVAHAWPEHEVRFPDHARVLAAGYATITSERLDRIVRERLRALPAAEVITGEAATLVGPGRVVLAGGRELGAGAVVDARGPQRDGAVSGWQKFVGVELELRRPLAPPRPLLMDATVAQQGGFRFVYVLPLAPGRVLVEDTVYADDPGLDLAAMRAAALAWADAHGLGEARIVREERGVLPIPLAADERAPIERDGERGPTLLRAGYAGGWFHPTTGYSLPVALRVARAVAAAPPGQLAAAVLPLWAAHARQARYARWLNRLLFRHFAPAARWHVLSRFYRLPEPTIRRFYALETSAGDRARILCGRPPRGLSLLSIRNPEAV